MATGSIDYGTHKIATHSFTEDAVTKDVERIAPAAGVVSTCAWGTDDFAMTSTGMSSTSVSTVGKGRIIILARALSANVTSSNTYSFRLAFYAADGGYMGSSALVSPGFGSEDDGGPTNIYATPVVFANDVGASTAKIYLQTLPGTATSISIMLKAI